MSTPKPFPRRASERYLRRLGRKYGVKIRWVHGRRWHQLAMAYGTTMKVHIPKPNNPVQLLVALHEFGHLLCSVPLAENEHVRFLDAEALNATPGMHAILKEAAAWEWAVEHIPPEAEEHTNYKAFEKTVGRGLTSHYWAVFTAHEDGG